MILNFSIKQTLVTLILLSIIPVAKSTSVERDESKATEFVICSLELRVIASIAKEQIKNNKASGSKRDLSAIEGDFVSNQEKYANLAMAQATRYSDSSFTDKILHSHFEKLLNDLDSGESYADTEEILDRTQRCIELIDDEVAQATS